jgi:membrane fusion protein, multidrug efflux system
MRGMVQVWRRGLPPFVGALAVVLVLSGCGRKNKYAPPPPAKVTVATPVQMPVTLYAEFTGNTAAVATVDLMARVQGFLTSINYRDGEIVPKGRILFEIEKDQYQAQVDLQKAQLVSAKAKQVNAEREYNRQNALGKNDFSSQRTVDDAKTNLDTANAQVAATEANLKLAETSLAYATVQAPFHGIVTRHLADANALVGSGGPSKLATILQSDPIYVYFNITERQLIQVRDELVKEGKTLKQMREDSQEMPMEIALAADTAFQYKGKIDYMSPQVDASTGTLQLRGVLENKDAALVPGLFVRVRLPVDRIDDALLVNDTAVMSNQAGSYVMVVGKDNVAEQRQVTTGAVEGPLRVITKGLSPEDKVVIGSIQRAVAGNTVEPASGAMAAAPGELKPAPSAPAPGAVHQQSNP